MNALEMESESLVGGRKKLNRSGSSSVGRNGLAQTVVQKNFMTNVVVAASIALLLLLYVSTHDSNDVDSLNGDNGSGVQIKEPIESPIEIPVAAPVDVPIQPPVEAPSAPVESPTTTSVTESPPTAPPVAINNDDTDDDDDDEDEPLPRNVYSKFATFEPLPNLPLADEARAAALADKYGAWNFWDGDEDERPSEDYLAKHPNGDVPADEFPEGAWQTDSVFVNHYLSDAESLIKRAQEAIYAEYGHPRDELTPEQIAERANMMFHWQKVDLDKGEKRPASFEKKGKKTIGGWLTTKAHDGLVRRLLHAMMTSDTFTVMLGGHSVAAGAGNKFQQNYMMQFHKIMAPIFAHLGIKLVSRNIANGGLGTIQNGLAAGSLYGDELDILLWDSAMTESDARDIEIFIRQAILGTKRAPLILGSGMASYIIEKFHKASVDMGEFGTSRSHLPILEKIDDVEKIPWAARFMNCTDEVDAYCKEQPRFCCNCWIDGWNGLVPPVEQHEQMSGNTNWHPGWREHQLIGRAITFGVLHALQDAIQIFVDGVADGAPLDDSYWHVTDYYKNIRETVLNMDLADSECFNKLKDTTVPSRICTTPLKGASQFTPRANYEGGSVVALIKPAPNGYVPHSEKKNLFDGLEPENPCMKIPEGEVDVYAIVTGKTARRRKLEEDILPGAKDFARQIQFSEGRKRSQHSKPEEKVPKTIDSVNATTAIHRRRMADTGIVPGIGWQLRGENSGVCDGSYTAECKREGACILGSYHSARAGVYGSEYSGWLVMNLPAVKEGIVMLKLQTWEKINPDSMIYNWTSVNNEGRRSLGDEPQFAGNITLDSQNRQGKRQLKGTNPTKQPSTMVFEYAIDGKITTLPRDEFLGKLHAIQRTVHLLTVLDDPSYTTEPKDVEVAFRMLGCGNTCYYAITHVYWA